MSSPVDQEHSHHDFLYSLIGTNFLDLDPLNQIKILNLAQGPLMIRFGMQVLGSYRRLVRKSVSPFAEDTMEDEEYYKLRGCLSLDSISMRSYSLLYACPLSYSSWCTLKEWFVNIIIECIDEHQWTYNEQEELNGLILENVYLQKETQSLKALHVRL